MKTVLRIVEDHGGWERFQSVRVENPPFMPLIIEVLGEPGPSGLRAISVAHYGELNGDAMRDPEICAEVVVEDGTAKLWPFYFRNDYVGVERWSRFCGEGDSMTCHPRETRDLEQFMELWDENLREQRFLEASSRMVGSVC